MFPIRGSGFTQVNPGLSLLASSGHGLEPPNPDPCGPYAKETPPGSIVGPRSPSKHRYWSVLRPQTAPP
jgi:hypothetical protein